MIRRIPRGLAAVMVGAALLAVTAGISAGVRRQDWTPPPHPHIQFGLLAAGIALVTWGLSRNGTQPDEPPRADPRPWWVFGLLAALTAGALVLRLLYAGESIRVLVDELHFLAGTLSFWKPHENIGLLTPMTDTSPFTWLFPYWQANLVALFGRSLGSLRAASAIVGALNIPALYLLARALFDRRVALLAAGLLAVFPPHLHYSRIALLSITDPLFGTLALAFLARGLQTGRRLDYALAGTFLGLTQYFYEGGRLFFAPLAAAWVLMLAMLWRKNVAAYHWRGLLAAGAAALLVSAPVYYTLLARGAPLAGRMDASGLNAAYWNGLLADPVNGLAAHLTQRVFPALLVYAAIPEATAYYGGGLPLVLPPLAPFFLLGLILALRQFRRPGNLLLLLWPGLTALANSLLVVSHASTRYVVVFPALALASAVGLEAACRRVTRRAPGWARAAVPIGAAAVLAAVQVGYYFGPHLGSFDANLRATRPHRDLEDTVYRSLDFPPGTQIHIVSGSLFDRGYANQMLAFFRPDLEAVGYLGSEELIADLPRLRHTTDQAFFIEPEDVRTLAALQANFALEGPFFSPYRVAPERQFVLFFAPRLGESGAVDGQWTAIRLSLDRIYHSGAGGRAKMRLY
ncbi:MAG: hypothetical protein BroJett038_26910 [Chloroflexota bacterium]|nr:MAG: hypothetical protein BroJett038_26910 [Chloroflexota bacterium]